ncbi:hypothetical protein KKG31_05700 [Patescibacteria group bacterium]|nr:hypothetical protein [Patescibacteria group bacterium]MBU1758599.1 hypothetical protein [Patescibacteria group bacterium]
MLNSIKSPKIIDLNYEKLSEFVFGKRIEDLDKEQKAFEMLVQKYLEGI